MINFIEGKVVDKQDGYVVIENNQIGYEIFVSNFTQNKLPFENEMARLFTYMSVREDGITLYGFFSKEEKDMFLKLISVSGIGPKMAMGILSNISIVDLTNAIFRQDIKMLCTVKGLGKKTAERLLVELKDKTLPTSTMVESEDVNMNYIDEATDALVSLGVGKNEAYRLARENAQQCSSVEEIITKVLRGMGNWWQLTIGLSQALKMQVSLK